MPATPLHYCFFTLGSWNNSDSYRSRFLGNELIKLGLNVSYLVDDVPYNHTDLDVHPSASVQYIPYKSFAQFKARRQALDRLNPDYLHVIDPSVKAFLALRGRPRLKLVADYFEWRSKMNYGLASKLRWSILERWGMRRASIILSISQYMQEGFRREYGRDSVYLPYAAYLPPYPDGPSPFARPTAVYMGNYYAHFDHDILFHAALILKQRGRSIPITFLGRGPDQQKWAAFVRDHQLTDVTLTGFITSREAMWQHLRHAHMLLFPIRPTVVNLARCPAKLYAYAQAGRPVITTRVGQVPEVLGEHPHYIPPTPEAYADAIEQYIDRPRPADVSYDMANQTWAARAQTLLAHL